MGEPILCLWKGLVDAVVKVLVVGEDNVSANIVELSEPISQLGSVHWERVDLRNLLESYLLKQVHLESRCCQ